MADRRSPLASTAGPISHSVVAIAHVEHAAIPCEIVRDRPARARVDGAPHLDLHLVAVPVQPGALVTVGDAGQLVRRLDAVLFGQLDVHA